MMDKPKRPLSSYNLFYRYKRSKILEVHDILGDDAAETINNIIMAAPGLEDYTHDNNVLASDHSKEYRRDVIRGALINNLKPKAEKRSHRKKHGAMSFLEMNKLMCTSWKAIDEFAANVFEELAEEGRAIHQEKVQQYEKERRALERVEAPPSPTSSTKSIKSLDVDSVAGDINPPFPKTFPKTVNVSSAPIVDLTEGVHSFMEHGENVSYQQMSYPMMTFDDAPSPPTVPSKVTTFTNKKKKVGDDGDRPKRALTSYNLFYRFKRFKILEALEAGISSEEKSKQIIDAPPGLESYPSLGNMSDFNSHSPDYVKNVRRNEIRATLSDENLSPKARSRAHRRGSLGDLNFHELTRLICASWKDLDYFSRSIFNELADESKLIHLKRVAEYKSVSGKDYPQPAKKKVKTNIEDPIPALSTYDAAVSTVVGGGGYGLLPPYSPVSPNCVASTLLDYPKDVMSMPPYDSSLHKYSEDHHFVYPYVSDHSSVSSSDDFSHCGAEELDFPLPFMEGPTKRECIEPTANDFLELIAKLI